MTMMVIVLRMTVLQLFMTQFLLLVDLEPLIYHKHNRETYDQRTTNEFDNS